MGFDRSGILSTDTTIFLTWKLEDFGTITLSSMYHFGAQNCDDNKPNKIMKAIISLKWFFIIKQKTLIIISYDYNFNVIRNMKDPWN